MITKWKTPTQRQRDHEWSLLRGRRWKLCGLTRQFLGYFVAVDWKQMPSNQFASADEMRQSGWAMCQCRDEQGRLR